MGSGLCAFVTLLEERDVEERSVRVHKLKAERLDHEGVDVVRFGAVILPLVQLAGQALVECAKHRDEDGVDCERGIGAYALPQLVVR